LQVGFEPQPGAALLCGIARPRRCGCGKKWRKAWKLGRQSMAAMSPEPVSETDDVARIIA